MRRIFAQIRKELTQIARDRLALALALVLPVMLMLIVSTALSLTVSNLPMVVQDLDDSPASRAYIDAFRASITFHVVSWPVERNPEDALTANRARAVLIIPRHFGRDLARGYTTQVQLLVDGTDANSARLVQGYTSQITRAFVERTAGTFVAQPVNAEIRLWFNPGRQSNRFFGPGVFVLALSMFPPLLAALAMSREMDQKTILQVYVSSISAHEFVLGKILASTCIALAEWCVAITVLIQGYGLSFVGDPTPLIVGTILYAFCVAAFGTLVGAAIPNQAAAMQAVALGGFLLILLLSGLIFPVENIPPGLRWISNLVWGRYYIELVRNSLLQGGGWSAMWTRVAAIGVIASVFYTLAWLKMRRMQVTA